jgi:molybdenum ABC transporter molybdate-binding protein
MLIRVFLLLLLFTPQVWANELDVMAPANLKLLITEISNLFQQKNPGWSIEVAFMSPQEIVEQIKAEAPTDVLIVDEYNLNLADLADKIGKPQELFRNELVVIADEESEINWDEMKKSARSDSEKLKRVALLPETTILGKQIRDYLKKLGFTQIPPEKINEVKHMRGALEAVKSGDVKWAIVYANEAARSKKLKVLEKISASDIPSIVYVGAVVKSSDRKKIASEYLQIFQSRITRTILENSGYKLPEIAQKNSQPKTQTQGKEKQSQSQPKTQKRGKGKQPQPQTQTQSKEKN